ncbi:translation initiation factor 2 [Streptomyces sp. TRM64462]|uniref:translation initiation factor 2 n=1 Tax=Streptomyces sp. TRM64462 TaxID=2741726 RepID=UPI001C304CB8|nr:translation initiation factor 2 [Streptomyces sp. TRM64462]
MPAFRGDDRVQRRFVLVPGSDFGLDALAALEGAGARTLPWEEAVRRHHDLVLAASPKGELQLLDGPLVLLPHGAGFNKALRDGGSADSASGLDATHLIRDGRPLARLHALAHPHQIDRIAARSPEAARRGVVVGDPTLDRLLASTGRRDRYREAFGTGGRRLVVLTSTWGPESLIRRRPGLAAELAALLPYDDWQLGLVVHANVFSEDGAYDLRERLAPAFASGAVLARPYEEWGALLVAADAVVTDHGSTALYAAALGRPVLAACDGGREVVPGSPMAGLLRGAPRFTGADDLPVLEEAVRDGRAGERARRFAAAAFDRQGEALERLRHELYRLLGLEPPDRAPAEAEPLPVPVPSPAVTAPAAFAVRVRADGPVVVVARHPPGADVPLHHLAAEADLAATRQRESAALLYRRTAPEEGADEWAARTLKEFPGCRTAAVVVSRERCFVRRDDGAAYDVRVERREPGPLPDPAAVLSAVHVRLEREPGGGELECAVGGRRVAVRVTPDSAGGPPPPSPAP